MAHLLAALVLVAMAQEETDPAKSEKLKPIRKSAEWKTAWAARLDLDYNSNAFLLDGDDQDKLLQDLPGDQISGRFDDMESIEDWIAAPSLRFGGKGPSPLGRKIELFAEFEWRQYLVNPARSHLRTRLGAEQAVGKDGRLDLDLEFLPEVFHKNYLVDATDFTGSVSSSERIYEDAHYLEFKLAASYRHTIVESGEFSLDGVAALGLQLLDFASPFNGRDEVGPSIELGVRAAAWKRVKAKVAFRVEEVGSPGKNELLLLDEPFFGADLNGDGDATDTNARTVQAVDRSRRESSFLFGVEVEIVDTVTAELGWTHTLKEWSSDEAFDIAHRDRSDGYDKIELKVKVRFSKEWEGRFGVEVTRQETDRPADPGSSGETSDYRRNVFEFSVIFRW